MVVILASLFKAIPRISYCSSVSFNAFDSFLWGKLLEFILIEGKPNGGFPL